jgi:hypothetical protein
MDSAFETAKVAFLASILHVRYEHSYSKIQGEGER